MSSQNFHVHHHCESVEFPLIVHIGPIYYLDKGVDSPECIHLFFSTSNRKHFHPLIQSASLIPFPEEQLITAILYVDSDGENEKLVNWELAFTENDGDPLDTIWIEWEALDELNDEYRRYAHSLYGLEEASKSELATAMYIEKTFPRKSRNHLSYRGLVIRYTFLSKIR